MAENKRYYWLKLQDDFFSSKRIKKLRKLAGGDTYTIIYLKMQLLSIKSEGVLTYTGLENSFAEELALDLDEDVENVVVTLNYLMACGLVETSDDMKYFLPYAVSNIGSEGSSAQRVRDFRAKALHCNTPVTQVKQNCNGEKEIDIEIDIDIDKEKELNKKEKESFEQFWEAYPKKVGKGAAEVAFNKLKVSKTLLARMIASINASKETDQWKRQGGQFIPYPATWLNQKRWEDDVSTYTTKLSAEGRVIDDERYKDINF